MKSYGLERAESARLLCGRVLWPQTDLNNTTLYEDFALAISAEGKLLARGPIAEMSAQYPDAIREDVSGIIAPAFADMHLHWVQHQVMGEFGGALLPWLHGNIFPAEARLLEPNARAKAADAFWHDMLACGTLAASIYATSAEASVDACLQRAVGVHLCGDSLMTIDCEPPLCRDPEETLAGIKRLHERWGEGYVVTPRFALSVSEELMGLAGAYARQHCLTVQTHLSENPDEISAVRERFPNAASYAEVYERAGLLHERCILAHCIHLDLDEWQLLAERKCLIAHCPSSNIALGSGRMDLEQVRSSGVDWVLATDIGAGPDLSQFDTMRAFIEQHHNHCTVSLGEAFARASVCALPERFQPSGGMPACLIELADVPGNDAATVLTALIDRYASAPLQRSNVVRGAMLGAKWVYRA